MWNELLTLNVNEKTDWCFTAPSTSQFFRLTQINKPELGLISIGQFFQGMLINSKTYSARTDSIGINLSLFHGAQQARIMGVMVDPVHLQDLTSEWQVKLEEFVSDNSDTAIIISQITSQSQQFRFVDLEIINSKPNSINPNLIDTEFWANVQSTTGYTVGNFHAEDTIIAPLHIVPPITSNGFKAILTGHKVETRKIKVAIFIL